MSATLMTEVPPTKRPRTIPSYMDVCSEHWCARFVKPSGAYKRPIVYIHNDDAPEFTLFTKTEPCGFIPFSPTLSFPITSQSLKGSGVDLAIAVAEDQACFLEQIELWASLCKQFRVVW